MAPDLNTLSSFQSPSTMSSSSALTRRPRRISINTSNNPQDHSPSDSPSLSSLQAAATMNASLYSASPSRDPISVERRRSSVQYNIHLNDPNVPGPGEMQHSNGSNNSLPDGLATRRTSQGGPYRHVRQRSLGEIYSSLEQEHEAMVNRLLNQIRLQQEQIQALTNRRHSTQDQQSQPATPTSAGPFSTSPMAMLERSSPRPIPGSFSLSQSNPFNRSNTSLRLSSHQLSNADGSSGNSPALRPVSRGSVGRSSQDFFMGGRNESAFYKAETQNLTRENQVLKTTIRELESRLQEMSM